jgi:hypothetical protein
MSEVPESFRIEMARAYQQMKLNDFGAFKFMKPDGGFICWYEGSLERAWGLYTSHNCVQVLASAAGECDLD